MALSTGFYFSIPCVLGLCNCHIYKLLRIWECWYFERVFYQSSTSSVLPIETKPRIVGMDSHRHWRLSSLRHATSSMREADVIPWVFQHRGWRFWATLVYHFAVVFITSTPTLLTPPISSAASRKGRANPAEFRNKLYSFFLDIAYDVGVACPVDMIG